METSHRVEYGAISHILLTTVYLLRLMTANGHAWRRIRANGRVDPGWLLPLSASVELHHVKIAPVLKAGTSSVDDPDVEGVELILRRFQFGFRLRQFLVSAGESVGVGGVKVEHSGACGLQVVFRFGDAGFQRRDGFVVER